jgi:DNA-binding MarR family transcriptional regulator
MLDVKNLEVETVRVARRQPVPPDVVDRHLVVWGREVPTLDLETEGVVERLHRLGRQLQRDQAETLERFGISWGEFRVLGALRYAGEPYRASPGQLSSECDVSSGGMTARLDKMERAGLVRRLPDPDDRRGVQVELTDEGWKLWQKAVVAQGEREAAYAAALTGDEKRRLNDLLRRLSHALDAAGTGRRAKREKAGA